MSTSTYAVEGMTCGNCVSAVTSELAALAGVNSVDVELVADAAASMVTVTSDRPLARAEVAAALDEAGDYRIAD